MSPRQRIVAVIVVVLLGAYAYGAPGLRRQFMRAVIRWDAVREPAVELPQGMGMDMSAAPRVRVVLIDGLSESTAQTLGTWSTLCKSGIDLDVDVGFPTVSLPVQVSLWTGLTQQQTGVVFRSDRPFETPRADSIPGKVPGSIAIAENHGYIARSFAWGTVLPPAEPGKPARDADADAWKTQWEQAALAATRSNSRLAFVHILRVDTWGHRKGRDSDEYRTAAAEADAILGRLYAAAPDARWFLLADHGHLATGGHGGEEREVREVEHCIVGPGIEARKGGPVHLVDVSRAIADSAGVELDKHSQARPLSVALGAPLEDDVALPRLPLGRGVVAVFIVAVGIALSLWSVRRWWLVPWWFVLAVIVLLLVRGQPTLSTPMTYTPEGRAMWTAWIYVLPAATVAVWFALGSRRELGRRFGVVRIVTAQLALPLSTLFATLLACDGWFAMLGAHDAPVVPHFTAYTSALLLLTAHGAAAVALAALARTVHSVIGRRPPPETPRSSPSAD
ncbi:MAG TPA: alkaline phosphatase family protein [Kofleriaceae bacterium]|nr:alkaline phosphatase family protein [Kofleriaceae bacterium]